MPGVTKKDLYLAKSIGELNTMAEKLPPVKNVKLCVTSAQKLFKNAEETCLLGDEEKAYVLYMRFFNLITNIKKTPEYKKNERYYKDLIGMKNLITAMDQAEKLSSSLKTRYDEKEAEQLSKKLEALNAKQENNLQDEKTDDKEPKMEEKEEPDECDHNNKDAVAKTDGKMSVFISPNKLYSMLENNDSRLLIMDVRAEDEFKASHIRHTNCINVPAALLPPGITSNKIEASLPADSKDLWKQRASVDFIILVDWTGSEDDIKLGLTLSNLKDAIYKWDVTNVIKSEPLILQGGYNDFLLYYPMWTTNANIKKPSLTHSFGAEVPSLDNIDYDLDLSFLKNPEELAKERELSTSHNFNTEQTSDKLEEFRAHVPSVDRSKKPVLKADEKPNNISNTGINMRLSSTKANFNINKINNLDVARQELKDKEDGKPSKDTNIARQGTVEIPKPNVNRNLKPKLIPQTQELDSSSSELPGSESSSSASSQNGSTVSLELMSPKHTEYSDDEMKKIRIENERLVLEHKARLARLKKERDEMSELHRIKAEEMKETADLILTKKQIQEEILQLEELLAERERILAADKEKWVDEQMKKQEHIVKQNNEDVSSSSEQTKTAGNTSQKRDNIEQKNKEMHDKEQREETTSKQLEEKPKEERQKEERLREESLREERLREERQRELQLKEERLRQEKLKREQEEQVRTELEKKAKKEQEAKMRLEQEEREQQQQHKTETVQAAIPKQAAEKSNLVTPGLEAGWQKMLDTKTGRYYYINHHTKKSQWEPPQFIGTSQEKTSKVYKMPLKRETDAGTSGGLARSHSSPNIAKMMADEEEQHKVISQPMVDRAKKPALRKAVQPITIQTEVSAAKVRNLQPIWGSMGRGLTGLRNLGNTCYMNSIIQCLSNTTPLTTYFLSDQYKLDINRDNIFGKGGEVAEEYAVLIKALWCGQYKSISPRDFKTTVGKYHELFASHSQQDSQELLLFLMDGLHEDLNRVTRRKALPEQDNDDIPDEVAAEIAWKLHKSVNESIIVQLFQGQFKSTVRCLTCNKKSVTFDVFMYLTLPVPSNVTRSSLRDCFLNFSKEEKMSGASRWHCPRCKCPRDAVKQIVIWKLPPILLVHLKRFYYQGMWRQKITTSVDFPLDGLDMSKYISGPHRRSTYSLYAVSNHYGSLDGGHYTAFCKNSSGNRWYKYDDHEVYDISSKDIQSPAAYILFYTCIDMPPVFK